MECAHCKKQIDDDHSYWENEDGDFFCSEECLDQKEPSELASGD